MTLRQRVARIEARHPPPSVITGEDGGVAAMCAILERWTPVPRGEGYADVYVRLDAALDRLYVAGVGIPTGPLTCRADRIAAVLGMTRGEYDAALRERAEGARR